jgi:hypothetical protein
MKERVVSSFRRRGSDDAIWADSAEDPPSAKPRNFSPTRGYREQPSSHTSELASLAYARSKI